VNKSLLSAEVGVGRRENGERFGFDCWEKKKEKKWCGKLSLRVG
jgi:hypothetical protein